ncbi:3-oxoacid CoA-transferase subunit B [Paenibacillus sp. N1-5-1-14]|uniref:3-oxoacid CoA-transferase subunit B n=1 Tax=Paenibacillus radicibacter TaxID=2972488 RepID=UPI002158DC36|nr:3-oxoacid CoA-transferase subunit B [Paenibacillus radicibacter]MCR8641054.1 3-oxoacid CoA-transferase subunit B [Paenibacillus radicibacter]
MGDKERIASRVAQELRSGDIVNLGIGIPTLVVDYLAEDVNVFIHSENGILGVGPTPSADEVDPDLVNAGKLPVTVLTGAAYFDSASSFAMIRGGHVDVSILGALQVNRRGQIANWAVPGSLVLGVGGAMDLLEGTKRVIVATTHCTKEGAPKLVAEATYPLTSLRRADLIVTELAIFEVDDDGLTLIEVAPDITLEELQKKTDAPFQIRGELW